MYISDFNGMCYYFRKSSTVAASFKLLQGSDLTDYSITDKLFTISQAVSGGEWVGWHSHGPKNIFSLFFFLNVLIIHMPSGYSGSSLGMLCGLVYICLTDMSELLVVFSRLDCHSISYASLSVNCCLFCL